MALPAGGRRASTRLTAGRAQRHTQGHLPGSHAQAARARAAAGGLLGAVGAIAATFGNAVGAAEGAGDLKVSAPPGPRGERSKFGQG